MTSKAGWLALLGVALCASLLSAGCAHDYFYRPVGMGPGDGPAARYPIPPEAPQGEAWITSFGFTDMEVEAGRNATLLHARLAVSNASQNVWTVDGREQALAAPGQAPQGAAFLNTDAGAGPVYTVPPGQSRVFDLYFIPPPPLDHPQNLAGFELDWRVNAGGAPIAMRTPFQRFEGQVGSYAGYPPYVAVHLGWGLGWWYGPYYPYRYRYPPLIRGYYYPPIRGRTYPGWHGGGVAPSGGGWRGHPSGGGGGWRGTPAPSGGGWRGTPGGGGGVPRGGGGGGWRGRAR
jgi:hypothetical protein